MSLPTRRLLAILPLILITGCSSNPPTLPDTWKLETTSKSQNYYYCESCPPPTKLANQVYQPLEPDEPIVAVKPVVEPAPVIKNNTKRRHKIKKHKRKHKQAQVQTKQCIKWSN